MSETTVTQPPKAKKWTKDEFAEVLVEFEAADRDPASCAAIGVKFGRSTRMIQGKLTTEKDENGVRYYTPPVKTPAAKKDDGPTKSERLLELATLGYVTEGLDGATKPALERLTNFVRENVKAA